MGRVGGFVYFPLLLQSGKLSTGDKQFAKVQNQLNDRSRIQTHHSDSESMFFQSRGKVGGLCHEGTLLIDLKEFTVVLHNQ